MAKSVVSKPQTWQYFTAAFPVVTFPFTKSKSHTIDLYTGTRCCLFRDIMVLSDVSKSQLLMWCVPASHEAACSCHRLSAVFPSDVNCSLCHRLSWSSQWHTLLHFYARKCSCGLKCTVPYKITCIDCVVGSCQWMPYPLLICEQDTHYILHA